MVMRADLSGLTVVHSKMIQLGKQFDYRSKRVRELLAQFKDKSKGDKMITGAFVNDLFSAMTDFTLIVSESAEMAIEFQDRLNGLAASVALLIGPGECIALLAVAQHLSNDGRFHYLGGCLPLAPDLDERARRLAGRAVHAVEGLAGYVGVDLVLGAASDGSEDVAIEINPRLTTSYIGLRRLAQTNLADAMLRIADADAPLIRWRNVSVEFRADGLVRDVFV